MTSPPERKTASLIEGWLRDLRYQIEKQRFPIHSTPWVWMRLSLLLSFVFSISAGFPCAYFPLLAVFCCTTMLAALPLMEMLWTRRNRAHKTSETTAIQSTNILAYHSVSKPNPALTICLMAAIPAMSWTASILWCGSLGAIPFSR